MNYQGKKVAIVGYGVEGQSSYRYWQKQGAELTICDGNENVDLPTGVASRLGKDYLENLDDFDLIVRTPGILPNLLKTTKPVTSNLNEFLAVCQGVVIGVTGTKGKGTTTVMIYHILTTAIVGGVLRDTKAFIGGNIGRPPLDFVEETTPSSYSVIEMSNLQLWDVTKSPDIAVILMLAPEHLDWHGGNLDEYMGTKANITAFQEPSDLLVYDPSNKYAAQIANASQARKMPYTNISGAYIEKGQIKVGETVVCATTDIPLLGSHNDNNVAAAVAATWDIVKDVSSIKKAITSTKPLPHRLELVAEKNGVKYYDDSYGTTADTVIAAVNAVEEPKVLILGGADKGVAFDAMAEEVAKSSSLRQVIVIGQTGPVIKKLLVKNGLPEAKITDGGKTMKEIVKAASQLAQAGDAVLLAPGCASFDMFKNYSERGDQFQAAAQAL